MPLESKLITALKWSAIVKFLGQVINWSFTFLTIRLLTPDDYGLFAITMASIALFTLINEFGLGAALVQTRILDNTQIRSANGFIIFANVLIFIFIYLTSAPIANFFDDQRLSLLLQVSALQFLIGALAIVPRSLLTRNIDFKNRELISLGRGIINAVSTYYFALLGYGVWSLIYGALISSLISTIALNFANKKFYFPSLSIEPIRSLIDYSGNILIQRVIWWLYTQADVFILKKSFESSVVGIFFTAKHLASMPQDKMSAIINDVILTGFSKINEDKDKVKKQTLRILAMLSTFIFPLYYGIAATSEILVPILIGEQWLGIIEPLFLLCLIYPLRMLNTPIAEVINALGFAKVNTFGTMTSSFIMIISIIIGAQWGVIGVCYAWLIGYPIAFSTFNLIAYKYTNVSIIEIISCISPALLNSIAMMISVKLLYNFVLIEPGILNLFLSVTVGFTTYLTLTLINNKYTLMDITKILNI